MSQNNQQYGDPYGTYQQPYNPYMSTNSQQGGPGYQQGHSNQGYQSIAGFPRPQQTFPNGPIYAQTPNQTPPMPSGAVIPTKPGGVVQQLKDEQSYIENIFRLNRGKIATVYMTFENNREWNAKIFKGVVEEAGRDHLILKDPTSELHFLLPLINFDYATFDEDIEYSYPFNSLPGVGPGITP